MHIKSRLKVQCYIELLLYFIRKNFFCNDFSKKEINDQINELTKLKCCIIIVMKCDIMQMFYLVEMSNQQGALHLVVE